MAPLHGQRARLGVAGELQSPPLWLLLSCEADASSLLGSDYNRMSLSRCAVDLASPPGVMHVTG